MLSAEITHTLFVLVSYVRYTGDGEVCRQKYIFLKYLGCFAAGGLFFA